MLALSKPFSPNAEGPVTAVHTQDWNLGAPDSAVISKTGSHDIAGCLHQSLPVPSQGPMLDTRT